MKLIRLKHIANKKNANVRNSSTFQPTARTILNVYANIPTNSMTLSVIVAQKETVEDVTRDLIQHGLVVDMKKKGKLLELNNRIQKEGGAQRKIKQQEENYDEKENEDEVSAYDLYRTPHGYIRFNVKI